MLLGHRLREPLAEVVGPLELVQFGKLLDVLRLGAHTERTSQTWPVLGLLRLPQPVPTIRLRTCLTLGFHSARRLDYCFTSLLLSLPHFTVGFGVPVVRLVDGGLRVEAKCRISLVVVIRRLWGWGLVTCRWRNSEGIECRLVRSVLELRTVPSCLVP